MLRKYVLEASLLKVLQAAVPIVVDAEMTVGRNDPQRQHGVGNRAEAERDVEADPGHTGLPGEVPDEREALVVGEQRRLLGGVHGFLIGVQQRVLSGRATLSDVGERFF